MKNVFSYEKELPADEFVFSRNVIKSLSLNFIQKFALIATNSNPFLMHILIHKYYGTE